MNRTDYHEPPTEPGPSGRMNGETMTANRIVSTARMLADTVERGVAAGLPQPFAISSLSYSTSHISVDSFEAVEAWAAHYGVTAERRVPDYDPGVEFCEAIVETDGFTWKVVNNRRVPAEVSA